MKISLNWLKDYIETSADIKTICNSLTNTGLEVESVETISNIPGNLNGIVVGEIISCDKHPNADKLKITSVDIGEKEALTIICGAPNADVGLKVAVATIGTTLKDEKGNLFQIKKSKIRDVYSYGMLCSEKELQLGENNDGIMILPQSYIKGTPIVEFLNKEIDTQIEIGLTPNRSDAMSHLGVARDLFATFAKHNISCKKTKALSYPQLYFPDNEKLNIQIEQPGMVKRYMGVRLKNIKILASPSWLQERLLCIGIKPINNVVDVTNYILHDVGQPLHVFDWEKINAEKIIVRSATDKEQFETLDSQNLELSLDDLVIADIGKPMCLAGVMGGVKSGVTEHTQSIFLEAAVFDPIRVRKTSKQYNIFTDSSFRFERGVDPNYTPTALAKAIKLLQEIAGAEIDSSIYDYYPVVEKEKQLAFDLPKMKQLLGIEIPKEEVVDILKNLDFTINKDLETVLDISIPTYRVDVSRQADVVEEILRIYGYNEIPVPSKLSTAILPGSELDANYKKQEKVANQLVALGFYEAINLSLQNAQYKKYATENIEGTVDIYNPLSIDLSQLRTSLLPGLLYNVSYNLNRQQNKVALFEYGKIYSLKEGKSKFNEETMLALVLSGYSTTNWLGNHYTPLFYELKGVVDQLLTNNNIHTTEIISNKSFSHNTLIYNYNNAPLVTIGTVSLDILKEFDIAQETIFAQFNWELFYKAVKNHSIKYKELPKFPFVKRDLSLLLTEDVLYQDLKEAALSVEKNILKNVSLSDVYTGEKIGVGKKSYTLSFQLQKETGTLTEQEIEVIMNKIIKTYTQRFNAELRS